MEFNSLSELYERILPALKIKSNEINNIYTEKEIWDFLTEYKWINSVDLSLAEMVNDILKLDTRLMAKK